jgi:hypothetical protein
MCSAAELRYITRRAASAMMIPCRTASSAPAEIGPALGEVRQQAVLHRAAEVGPPNIG